MRNYKLCKSLICIEPIGCVELSGLSGKRGAEHVKCWGRPIPWDRTCFFFGNLPSDITQDLPCILDHFAAFVNLTFSNNIILPPVVCQIGFNSKFLRL